MLFWIVAAVVVLVLLGLWLWADLHQPRGNPAGDEARAQGRIETFIRHRNSSG